MAWATRCHSSSNGALMQMGILFSGRLKLNWLACNNNRVLPQKALIALF